MRVINNTKIPDRAIRRAVAWAAKTAGFRSSMIQKVFVKISFAKKLNEVVGTTNFSISRNAYDIEVYALYNQTEIDDSLSSILWWISQIRWHQRGSDLVLGRCTGVSGTWPSINLVTPTYERLKNAVTEELKRDWLRPDGREKLPQLAVGEVPDPEILAAIISNGNTATKKTKKQASGKG